MKFKSIRQKLIVRVSTVFVLSFVCVMSIVGIMNANESQRNLDESKSSIEQALIAKGKLITANNSEALKGMAEDNAFSAVSELVSSTVAADEDIVYGIFMDVKSMPWVYTTAPEHNASIDLGISMNDSMSMWASNLQTLDFQEHQWKGETVFEFAAPVSADGEVLGFIRYGLSTQSMVDSVNNASVSSSKNLKNTMFVLIAVGVLAIAIGVISTRRVAAKITTPLNSLTDTAELIAAGDYINEVKVSTDDEIGILANSFETMRVTIQKKISDLAKLNSTGEKLSTTMKKSKAFELVLDAILEQTGLTNGSILISDQEGTLKEVELSICLSESKSAFQKVISVSDRILQEVIKNQQVTFIEETSKALPSDELCDTETCLLFVPLIANDSLIGFMRCIGFTKDVHFTEADKEFAEALARQLVITIKNIEMLEVIEEQNRTLEQKVEERTSELAQKTNDIRKMMENMHQGLFTVMSDSLVHHEYSKYLENILGTKSISERNVMDLLFRNSNLCADQLDQISVSISSIVGEDELMFEFNSHLLPTEYVATFSDQDNATKEKIIELDWDPIVMDGQVEKLMVTVRDVTEVRALQASAEEQRKEMEIIGQILSVEGVKFNDFVSTSKEFIKECEEIVLSCKEKDLDVVAELFRKVHTIKGNSRTYAFTHITNAVHLAENTYDRLRKEAKFEWNQEQLRGELETVASQIALYEHVNNVVLGRGSIRTEQSQVDEKLAMALHQKITAIDVESLSSDVKELIEIVNQSVVPILYKSLPSILTSVVKSVLSLACELDKQPPKIEFDCKDILITHELVRTLENIFMHILRNALDHGIESPSERLMKDKAEYGTVTIVAKEQENKLRITIEDDGRGLALNKIEEKARAQGILTKSATSQEIANCVFSSGFTTADSVTEVSGRGVGMDAVRRFLEEKGGSISIELDNEERAEYVPFRTTIELPIELCINGYSDLTSVNQQVA